MWTCSSWVFAAHVLLRVISSTSGRFCRLYVHDRTPLSSLRLVRGSTTWCLLRLSPMSRTLLSESSRWKARQVARLLVRRLPLSVSLRIGQRLRSFRFIVRGDGILLLSRRAPSKRILILVFWLRLVMCVVIRLHFLDQVGLLPELLNPIRDGLSLPLLMLQLCHRILVVTISSFHFWLFPI